jgi:hypothetical protein
MPRRFNRTLGSGSSRQPTFTLKFIGSVFILSAVTFDISAPPLGEARFKYRSETMVMLLSPEELVLN